MSYFGENIYVTELQSFASDEDEERTRNRPL